MLFTLNQLTILHNMNTEMLDKLVAPAKPVEFAINYEYYYLIPQIRQRYKQDVTCDNCGSAWVVLILEGVTRQGTSVKCPNCKCNFNL